MPPSPPYRTLLKQLDNVDRPVPGRPVEIYLNRDEYDYLRLLLERQAREEEARPDAP